MRCWKFTIDYLKTISKRRKKKQRINLELILKNLENNLNSEENRKLYNHYNNDLETIFDHIVNGIKNKELMWVVWAWASFFLISKKNRGVQNWVRKLIARKKEITDPQEMSSNIKVFYETVFKENSSKTTVKKLK